MFESRDLLFVMHPSHRPHYVPHTSACLSHMES